MDLRTSKQKDGTVHLHWYIDNELYDTVTGFLNESVVNSFIIDLDIKDITLNGKKWKK